MEFVSRRFQNGDEKDVCQVITKSLVIECSDDYDEEYINRRIDSQREDIILSYAEKHHAYTFLDGDKIVGVGMIGLFPNSNNECFLFSIFRDPDYVGMGLGRKIIDTLENDEYFLQADRAEVLSVINSIDFYKHFGYRFKRFGNILDNEGLYKLEKFPKSTEVDTFEQYNMRPYIDNAKYNFKEFIYQVKKNAYQTHVGEFNDEEQRKYFDNFLNKVCNDTWIIQLNGENVGFYSGNTLNDGIYEIINICILPQYQGMGIGTQVLRDIVELHKDSDIRVYSFKKYEHNIFETLGFELVSEGKMHNVMIKRAVK